MFTSLSKVIYCPQYQSHESAGGYRDRNQIQADVQGHYKGGSQGCKRQDCLGRRLYEATSPLRNPALECVFHDTSIRVGELRGHKGIAVVVRRRFETRRRIELRQVLILAAGRFEYAWVDLTSG
jgi:hypothetical protein